MTPQEKHLRDLQRALQRAREIAERWTVLQEDRRANLKAARKGD